MAKINRVVRDPKAMFNQTGDKKPKEKKEPTKKLDDIIYIPIEALSLETNVRKDINDEGIKELSESIKQYGILQPLRIYDDGKKYKIIFGQRRYLASQLAGLKEVPCIFNDKPLDTDIVIIQLIENLQKEDVSGSDLEKAIKTLRDKLKMSVEQIAVKIGKKPRYVYWLLEANKSREEKSQVLDDKGVNLNSNQIHELKDIDPQDPDLAKALEQCVENPDETNKVLGELKRKKDQDNPKKRNKSVVKFDNTKTSDSSEKTDLDNLNESSEKGNSGKFHVINDEEQEDPNLLKSYLNIEIYFDEDKKSVRIISRLSGKKYFDTLSVDNSKYLGQYFSKYCYTDITEYKN